MNAKEAIAYLLQQEKEHAASIRALKSRLEKLEADEYDFEVEVPLQERDSAPPPSEAPRAPVDDPEPQTTDVGEYREWVERQAAREAEKRAYKTEGDTVVIKGPTKRQRAVRANINKRIGWENWTRDQRGGPAPLPPEQGRAAFIEGGLPWLYLYDRNFVLEQQPATIQAMLIDLAETDPTTAEEIARDVMKDQSEGGGMGVAYDNILGTSG